MALKNIPLPPWHLLEGHLFPAVVDSPPAACLRQSWCCCHRRVDWLYWLSCDWVIEHCPVIGLHFSMPLSISTGQYKTPEVIAVALIALYHNTPQRCVPYWWKITKLSCSTTREFSAKTAKSAKSWPLFTHKKRRNVVCVYVTIRTLYYTTIAAATFLSKKRQTDCNSLARRVQA